MGDKKHGIFVYGLFVHITPTEHEQELNLFENSLFPDNVCSSETG
jgi:hypothetical protein